MPRVGARRVWIPRFVLAMLAMLVACDAHAQSQRMSSTTPVALRAPPIVLADELGDTVRVLADTLSLQGLGDLGTPGQRRDGKGRWVLLHDRRWLDLESAAVGRYALADDGWVHVNVWPEGRRTYRHEPVGDRVVRVRMRSAGTVGVIVSDADDEPWRFPRDWRRFQQLVRRSWPMHLGPARRDTVVRELNRPSPQSDEWDSLIGAQPERFFPFRMTFIGYGATKPVVVDTSDVPARRGVEPPPELMPRSRYPRALHAAPDSSGVGVRVIGSLWADPATGRIRLLAPDSTRHR